MRIGVNLLCFQSRHRAGAWVFFKRLIEGLPANLDCQFVFFCQEGFEIEKELRIPAGIKYKILRVPVVRTRIGRILYEQFIFPFRASGVSVLFSPCTANPVIHPRVHLVTTVHDLTPFHVNRKYGVLQTAYLRMITRLLTVRSNQVVTVSEFSKADIIGKLGISGDKISVIYNSAPAKDRSRVTYENFFLYVGTIQPGKNICTMVRAFAHFSKHYDRQNHRLVIAGAYGWGGHECEELIRELGMDSLIEVLGYVSDERLDDLYSRCKGLILLSLYEGFGIPVLEALAWHKPSLVSNVSSLPEVAGLTGIKVNPMHWEDAALALREIASNPRRYLKGRDEQLGKFSSERQVERLLDVLGIRFASVDQGECNA